MWKYTVPSDIKSVEQEQGFDRHIQGECDNMWSKYKLKNHVIIQDFEKSTKMLLYRFSLPHV